jgi:hypothetical protein
VISLLRSLCSSSASEIATLRCCTINTSLQQASNALSAMCCCSCVCHVIVISVTISSRHGPFGHRVNSWSNTGQISDETCIWLRSQSS